MHACTQCTHVHVHTTAQATHTCMHTFALHIHTCTCNMYTHTQKQEYINSSCSIPVLYFMYATTQSGNTMKYNSFTHSFNKCCWFCNRHSLELTSECKQLCNCLEANPGSFITNVWPASVTSPLQNADELTYLRDQSLRLNKLHWESSLKGVRHTVNASKVFNESCCIRLWSPNVTELACHLLFSDHLLFRKQNKTKPVNIPKVSELTALIPKVSSFSTKLCSKTVLISLVREGLFFKVFLICILLSFNFCSFSLPKIRFL